MKLLCRCFLVSLLLAAAFLTVHPQTVWAAEAVPAIKTETLKIKSGKKTHIFNIEIADTDPVREQGLMFRDRLPEKGGMLFAFQNDDIRYFWMRNTLIPLDILFIRADGVIHHIHPMAVPLDETPISSNGPVRAAIEIAGGQAAKLGLKSGDKVYHKFFQNGLAQ